MDTYKKNSDEYKVMGIAKKIPGVNARLSTPEEDCGYNKADVIATYKEQTYCLQVSHTPKSKKEHEKLQKRGTHTISTHKFEGIPHSEKEISDMIKNIIRFEDKI